MDITAGTKLGRYEIRSKIGEGGMGEVYLAEDTRLHRKVALKILPEDLASNKDRMRRFEQEAIAAAALNHPNIAHIYEIGEHDGTHYIATEYVDGQTLRRQMALSRQPLNAALDIAAQVASALGAVHQAGIIHRDIKPENVMVRRDGIVKVLDFGLAKLTERQAPSEVDDEAATLEKVTTAEGAVSGTPQYMSPEQARGQVVDARTDIFSLGAVLYEMIAGRPPFEGVNAIEVLGAILQRDPAPLREHATGIPDELQRIAMKALEKEREERYQVVKDLLLDLKSLKQEIEFSAKLKSGSSTFPSDSGLAAELTDSAQPDTTDRVKAFRTISSADNLKTKIKRHKLWVLASAVTVALLLIAVAGRFFSFDGKIDSIAVLPLANASGDPNTEYLSDGIAEALINSLTEVQRLRVVARSTAFRYKGTDVDPRTVGRDLNVRAVLMGRVRQIGAALNVQVDLVDASTGAQVWGEAYDRRISDMLAVKQDIAREITEKLRLRLTGEERKQLVKRDTTNAEAYELYLKGRYDWTKRTAQSLKRAIEQFRRAADKDPNYALAYVGLADCYVLLLEYADAPASETLPIAKAFALHALEIDDSLAEARTSLAYIHMNLWEWDQAEEQFKRAISLNPNYPTAHQWYNLYLRSLGRFDEALAEIKRARELDPLSLIINSNIAALYLMKGDVTSAIEQCQKTIEIDPSFPLPHDLLGSAYLRQGRYAEAITELGKAVELSGRGARYLASLGYCYAVSGRRAEAQAVLKELEENFAKRAAGTGYVAEVYAGLGAKDQALLWLEKGVQAGGALLLDIRWNVRFDPLRNDPRYTDLVRRMGLKP